MREKRCLAWILAGVLAGGCGAQVEPLTPAGELAEANERPADLEAADTDGSRSTAEADSTGRWGGSLGSGS